MIRHSKVNVEEKRPDTKEHTEKQATLIYGVRGRDRTPLGCGRWETAGVRSSLFFNRKLDVATLLGDLNHEAEIETQTEVENKHMNTEGEIRGGME